MRCANRICLLLTTLVAGLLLASPARAQLSSGEYNSLVDGWLNSYQGARYREAEQYARQIQANDQRYAPEKFNWRYCLAVALLGQSRYKETQPLLESFTELSRRHNGASIETVDGLNLLTSVYIYQGELQKAQSLAEETLRMGKESLGANHEITIAVQSNLAVIYSQQSDLGRAADLLNDIINRQHQLGVTNISNRLVPVIALSDVYLRQGRYQQVESILRYGIGTARALGAGYDHPSMILLHHSLGNCCLYQNRTPEAQSVLEFALTNGLRTLGNTHVDVGRIYGDLAVCYRDLEDTQRGLSSVTRALEILTPTYGENHPIIGVQYYTLGTLSMIKKDYAKAEESLRRALSIAEKSAGLQHRQTAETKATLGRILINEDKDQEATKLLKESLAILESQGISQQWRHGVLRDLSQIAWKQGKRDEAIEQLRGALDLAEKSRGYAGGGDIERAAAFLSFNDAYEQMIRWQVELNHPDEVLAAAEQVRARTFREAISLARVDLLQGKSPSERAQLEKQRTDLRTTITRLEGALDAASAADREKLVGELNHSRSLLIDFERDLRSSSPVYHQMIATQAKTPNFAALRQQLLPGKSLLLSYFVGSEHSYLLAIDAERLQVLELKVSDDDAKIVGVAAGPLTREICQKVLQGDPATSILPQISQPEMSLDLTKRLHAFWNMLVPSELRASLTSSGLERLTIIPDGPLALLPFEALIVTNDPQTTYLLDVAPPINYGPSLSVLMSLKARPAVEHPSKPVLTLGDPNYERSSGKPAVNANANRSGNSSTNRALDRSKLHRLPYSGTESHWVSQVFAKAGAEAIQFLGDQATEANIRQNIAGREIIHLACHGLSDNTYDNQFGMFAVTRGPNNTDPKNDGMLTLAEIYELDLRGCELAILSACRTNHGLSQVGEGVWALSRGFLVGGARRVFASNWVVDDAAGASLISFACGSLAKGRSQSNGSDYSLSLRDAKRWVRQQEKWDSPYYWAPIVMVGPN